MKESNEKKKFFKLNANAIERISRNCKNDHPFAGQIRDMEIWRARGFKKWDLREVG